MSFQKWQKSRWVEISQNFYFVIIIIIITSIVGVKIHHSPQYNTRHGYKAVPDPLTPAHEHPA